MDGYSRRIVGWRCSTSLATDLAADALEQEAVAAPTRLPRGARAGPSQRPRRQYLSVRYTDRLDAAGALRSVGSTGDSYDNAAAESLIGFDETELTSPGP